MHLHNVKKNGMIKDIQWLFFDIGSTLANEERVYEHLIRSLSEDVGRSYEEVSNMVLDSYKNGKNGFNDTVEKLGAVKPKWDPSLEFLYDDAHSVLKKLRSKYKIGIIANQISGCYERLKNFGIADFFDLVVFSADVGILKPDKRIFELALSKSKCRPQNAVMIGDRIDNDIAPANRLGMHTIWVKQGYGQYGIISSPEETPSFTVSSLSEILYIFDITE